MAFWDTISDTLAGGYEKGGMAQSQRGQVAPGETDWNKWSSVLGQGAQAFTAGDPTSWQHQLGKLGASLGQAGKMGMIQEEERKRKNEFRMQLMKLLGLDVGQGETKFGASANAPTQPNEKDPFGLGSLTMDKSLINQPKMNPVFKELGGW